MSESTERPGPATSPAGIYDYLLGGDASSTADRDAAQRIIAALPEIRQIAWANRGFLMRAVTWMAQEHGIRQFIDIGAGFPTQRPTHEVARSVAPECRVLYTDNDPAAVARGTRLLDGVPGTAVIEADIRQPRALFGHPETRRLIDPGQPTGLLVVAVTQFVADDDDPWSLVARHMAPLAPGSCLALSAPTADHKVTWRADRVAGEYAHTSAGVNRTRTKAEIERFFTGLELAAPYEGAQPGVAFAGLWGCDDPEAADDDASRWFYAGVAAKQGM
ncbi:MAG: SAM-dependent methyltransferase [Trebonia sp.]